MNRFLAFICAIIGAATLSLISHVGVASAHDLKQDNGISVMLHIPPYDNPIAGQRTELDFSFSDNQNAFSLPDCNCHVALKQNGHHLGVYQPKPALQGATLDAAISTRFPAAGVYDVVLSGQPKDTAFHGFQVDYIVRVTSSTAAPVTAPKRQGAVVVIAVSCLVILALIAYAIRKNHSPQPQLPQQKTKKMASPQKLPNGSQRTKNTKTK